MRTTASPRQDAGGALGRYFSYFSHRVFVAFRPVDLHAYLERLIEVKDEPDSADARDAEILRWVLLHRSRLNPLLLNRELEALRGPDDRLLVGPNLAEIRRNRIDVTLQYAVELALGAPGLRAWVERRPRMWQPVLDAAYYVSACFEREQAPHAPPGRASDELRLDAAGLGAFRSYLVHRMNLYVNESPPQDDEKARDRWWAERGVIEERALGEQDLRLLYRIAQDVAETLAYATSSTNLKKRWDDASKQQRDAMSAPSDHLLAALLLGPQDEERVLRAVGPAGDRMHLRWQVLPSGEATLDRSRHKLLDDGRPWAARWRRTDQVLRAAAFPAAPAVADDENLLRRLMEVEPLMRSPHRWASLVRAAQRLIDDVQEATVDMLEEDLQRLRGFLQKASEPSTVESVGLALVCAAALEGLTGREVRSRGLADGLEALGRGLRVDRCQPEEAVLRLRTLRDAVAGVVDGPLPALPQVPIDAWADEEDPGAVLENAFRLGRRAASVGAGADEDYWLAVAERVQASRGIAPTAVPPAASLVEILGWLARAPARRAVDLDLTRMTLRRWSGVLRHALDPSPQGAPEVPGWMAVHALERLGAGSLADEAQQLLLDRLAGDAATRQRRRDEVLQRDLWRGVHDRRRAALLVVGGATSVSDAWEVPPASGLVIVASAQDAVELLGHGLDDAIAGFGAPLLLAVEHPAPAPEELRRVEAHAASRLNALQTIRVYRDAQVARKGPHLVAPRSAGELWSADDGSA